MSRSPVRTLVMVLGDQLDAAAAVWDDFDPAQDRILMAEVAAESTHVWSSQIRTTLFLSAMRHFAAELRQRWGDVVDYRQLGDSAEAETLAQALSDAVARWQPTRVYLGETGDWRVEQSLREVGDTRGVTITWLPDRHFFATRDEFARFARGRKQLRLEYFYRQLRQRTGILMDDAGKPVGGQWNFDADNRGAFGRSGPGKVPPPRSFAPDAITREVIDLVATRFADHPGDLGAFDWPVTRAQAWQAWEDFCEHRLQFFGQYQDAMWDDEPWLYHSRLSAALNLKLLNPQEVVAGAVAAYQAGKVPLAGVEGFVRQILGWREYVRGLYWLDMPAYIEGNAMGAMEPLPEFYWSGACEMRCLQQAIDQTLRLGYAHHIQRLMVTGLYALMLGVEPKQVHAWYLAVYVDAVEWVELPNTLGMSQYADGGRMASKPYIATGAYLQRMSNHCASCRFDPKVSTGATACPFTTLYWDYLMRHETLLKKNPRMGLQVRNLQRLDEKKRQAIQQQAKKIRAAGGMPPAANDDDLALR